MDLVIAGAIIKDLTMIEKAILSAPKYDFDNKYILFDGYGGTCQLFKDNYQGYKHLISKKFPDFICIEFNENVYFREMIEKVCEISDSERLFVIQDDVCCHEMDLEQMIIQMNYVKDLKILCFPHMKIPYTGTKWYEPFDDTFPLPFIKSHGFSERTFICDRVNMLNICKTYPKNNKMNKRFIEFIYNTEMKRAWFKNASYDEKEDYWKAWGVYFHYDILHTHLVGKRHSLCR
tara:strand:- start:2830 stop:3528 length:699 start_codon:yes stop_codon:yes gene_type:complete